MKRMIFLLMLFLLAGCNITVLDPKSDTARDQAFLIWFSFGIMALVVLTVFILFIRFVWKYRLTKEKADFLPKDVSGSKVLEITWIVIPIILLAILAVPTIAITYNQSPVSEGENRDKDGVHVDVTAEQFLWTFTHENDKEVEDVLVIPEGENIILHLRSKDIIHSFWAPALGGKVDVMPHEELVYEIENPDKGTYKGKCAEYCGIQHANMTFEVKVVPMEDYDNYLEEK